MKNIGILGRGKSLERLSEIIDKFDDCFIVNDWRLEAMIFEDYLKGKRIIHFLNADRRSYLGCKIYRMLGITRGFISWTKLHEAPGRGKISRGKNTVAAAMNKYSKELYMRYMPDFLFDACNNLNSAGLICLLYVSLVLRPEAIWIAGIDFYCDDYLVRRRGTYRPLDTKKMAKDFMSIVNNYPYIIYSMVTKYTGLTSTNNLKIL